MTSYFNSYIPDLRNGTPDHYQTCTTPVNGSTPDPNCDPRNTIHHYGNHGGQQLPYPRFPPYDRLDIRAVGGANAPVNYGYGGPGGQLDNGGYRPPSPPPSVMGHAGVVPMQQQQVPTQQPNGPGQYASCKMQQQSQVSVGPPLSPDPSVIQVNVNVNHMSNANGNHKGYVDQKGYVDPKGGYVDPKSGYVDSKGGYVDSKVYVDPSIQQQHPHNHNHAMMGYNTNPMVQQPHPHQHPHGVPQQGQQHPGQMPNHHHTNQNHQNPHQSPPQQQNSPAAALPSPLYPWMRSQFGKPFRFKFVIHLL